jgi:predicted transcriptional regulator
MKKWELKANKSFQKEWNQFKDDYSTEGYKLSYVFEIYLPFWQVKQNVVVEKEIEDNRFTKILLQLIDSKINSRSGICSFLGIEKDDFCTVQLDFLVKHGLVREIGVEDYEITHDGLSFLEEKKKLKEMEKCEFEFKKKKKSTYLKDDLTENFFDPTLPFDKQLSEKKKNSFLGYKVLESHKIKEKLEKNEHIEIKHENRPTYRKLVENKNDFSEFYNKQHLNRTFYDFADSDIECHRRNICFFAFLYEKIDDSNDIKIDIRQSKNSVIEFEECELEHTFSKQVTEYVLKCRDRS